MIPKIIHYCWFGGNPLPEDVKRYIATWKRFCPDYEIREWNETNFDVNQNQYCKEAYEAKKWAFVSDYVRLKVLYDYGGIYMDSDVEVCKPLDDLLQYEAFSGFESGGNRIPTGTMGSARRSGWIEMLLKNYDERHFIKKDGTYDLTTNVTVISRLTVKKYGIRLDNSFQIFGDQYAMFPFDYLCAKSLETGKVMQTGNTYTIHHFAGSWLPETDKEIMVKYQSYYPVMKKYMPRLPAHLAARTASVFLVEGLGGVCWRGWKKLRREGKV